MKSPVAANSILEDVRRQIAPRDSVLNAARERLADVRLAAEGFTGALRSFRSGSVAHLTANDPVHDADGGIVIDRRCYPDVGPDGDDGGPVKIVDQVRDFIRPLVKKGHPNARFDLSKRGICIGFGEPVAGDQDPSVDLIVALTRKDKPGLWIPHLERENWDASNPETHTKVLEDAYEATSHAVQRAIRLVKAWNRQYDPPGLSSFNIEALGLEAITTEMSLAGAVSRLFRYAAVQLDKGRTQDPAGVSDPIRLLIEKDAVLMRLRTAADLLDAAIQAGDDTVAAQMALADVFFEYVEAPAGAASKAGLAQALRAGNTGVEVGTGGMIATITGVGRAVKTTRAYGESGRQ